jgi:hypothetical protein
MKKFTLLRNQPSYLFKFTLLLGLFYAGKINAQAPNFARSTQDISSGIFLNSGTYLKTQLLYAPGDLTGTTPIESGVIDKIYFSSTTAGQGGTYTQFYVRMGQTSNTTFTGTSNLAFYNTLDTLFYRSSFVLNGATTANDWFEIPLDKRFPYDKTKTLIIEVQMATQPTNGIATWSSGAGTGSPATPNHRKMYSTAVTALTGTAHPGYWQDFGIALTTGSYNNASISEIQLPNIICNSSETLKVRLANRGYNVLNSVDIDWELDGARQATINWNYPIDSSNNINNNPTDTLITLGNLSFSPLIPHTIKVWTSMPNGTIDTVTYNDTMTITVGQALSGPYSIGGSSPNFASIGAAVAAINKYGICGPVTFNIDAASSPYTEQITINQINGSSATNTITFNGNGSTIQFASTTADRHVIKLNGADYITFNNLSIVEMDATYGYGVHLIDGANYNTIDNCIINMSANTSTAEANSGGIVSSASTTTTLTAGNNASNLTVTNSTITGGYSGIVLNGISATERNSKNIIKNNTIKDFYAMGINILNLDSTVIENNDINRLTKTAVGTFTGVNLRGGNIRTLVSKNKIHGTHNAATVSTGIANGILITSCDAPVDSENVFVNNLIYDFNSASGAVYGLYNTGSDGTKFYHNTVVLDWAAATGGITRGFYQTTLAANIQFKNNIIYISRGGNGAKNCVYFGTNTSSIISNNNVLYLNSAAGTNGVGYFNANVVLLPDWKLVNGGVYDQQSRANDPMFVSTVAPLDYTPTEIGINDLGDNVGVATDFAGVARTTTPDPGAYEFTPSETLDAALSWVGPIDLIAPGNGTITVNVANNLTDPITSIEIEYTDGMSPVSETFSSLNILAGTSQQLSFVTPYNFTVPVNLRAYIRSVNGGPDGTQGNDSTFVKSICIAFPTGPYTINSALSTGGTNYQTFAAAITAVSACGVVGPIVFNVDPASGPYNEQIVIPAIKGTSATNTITFNGNNRRIFGTPVTATRAIIKLDGADYIIIDSLEIVSVSATYGWGVHLTNGADYNQVTNCTIDMSATTSTTEASSGCIVGSGSTTSTITDGSASYNLFDRNTLIGAYKGITLNGATGALFSVKNIVTNNIIKDFYQNGMEFTDNDSLLVEHNDISRANRAAVTTMAGVELGVGNQNCRINANKVHDTHNMATTQSGAAYGVYSTGDDAPVGAHNIVSNNVMYNFNSTTGTQYGLYNSSSNGVYYYYNTVLLDYQNSTSGATHGLYQVTLSTDIEIKNNIFSISRSGTGAKNCIYLSTVTSTVISDNNLFNMASSAGTVGVGYYDATNFPTLADWKTANGGMYDAQGISADPMFNSAVNLRVLDGSPAIGAAQPLVSISSDYLGFTRSATTPTIGAYETSGDFTGPVITIDQISSTSSTSNRTIGNNITITDASNIDTANHKARIYYKKTSEDNVYIGNTGLDNGWKWTSAITNTPPYLFEIDYTKLTGGSVAITDTIQYFIIAQDATLNHNVGTGSVILKTEADSVGLSGVHFPVSGTLNNYRIVSAISGNQIVGASSPFYHNLSEVAAALRSSEVTSNVVFELMQDYDGSTGEVFPIVFNNISLASPSITITIVPSASVSIPLSTEGYPASGAALITIDGGDNFIFDGRPGAIGDSTNMRWVIKNKRSAATFSPAILLVNGATNNTFRYLNIQSGNTLTTSGTFMLGASTGSVGNSFNTITNNYIRNRADSVGVHVNAFYSAGSVQSANSDNIISNNTIFNFNAYGVNIAATGNGDNWKIDSNHFYYDYSTISAAAQYGIYFAGSSNNNKIRGNYIGGSALHAGSTAWKNSGTSTIAGIFTQFGDGVPSLIAHNVIRNFERTNTGAGGFWGINPAKGNTDVIANVIGDSTVANSILIPGTTASYGIQVSNPMANTLVNIENNVVCNMTMANAGTGAIIRGIAHTSATPYPPCNIRNNRVFSLKTNSAQTGYAGGNLVAVGLYVFPGGYDNVTPSDISGNTVFDISALNTTAATNVVGAIITNFYGFFHHNTIYDIKNSSLVGSPVPATADGLSVRFVLDGSRIYNNMISLTGTPSDSVQMNGVLITGGTFDNAGDPQVYLYNSVQLSNNTGSPIRSYAFHRGENAAATQSWQRVVLKNNLFVNNITSAGKHFAVGNEGPLPDSLWIKAENDYNNFYSQNPANIGLWKDSVCDLTAWKSISGSEAHSVSKFISFVDPTISDLHLNGSSIGDLDLKGIPVVGFTNDFDGETRDLVTPYMGADENTAFPLPVTLVQFTATQSQNDVMLNWATATETNSSHFIVERSVNGKTFEAVAKVKASGKSNSVINYRSFDENAFRVTASNTLYYRLKMVDNDGKYEYSKTAIVSIKDKKETAPLSVFPNPYSDKTYLQVNATEAANANIAVVDITGKVVISYTEVVAEGSSVLSLQQSETLRTGIYFVSIEVNGIKQVAKLVKQ